jgi:hypothetical protein
MLHTWRHCESKPRPAESNPHQPPKVAAVIVTFIIASFATSNLYRSAPEAISTAESECPRTIPNTLSPQFASTATLVNSTLTFTPAVSPPAGSPPSPSQPFEISVVTTQTLVPLHSTHCLALRVPRPMVSTLKRVYLTSLDPDATLPGGQASPPAPRLCVCSSSFDATTVLPAPHPEAPTSHTCTRCTAALAHIPLNASANVYAPDDWFLLSLPEKVEARQALLLTWVSHPQAAFLASAPFRLPTCSSSTNAPAGCSNTPERYERALLGSPGGFMPSALERGAETVAYCLTVVVPDDVAVVWATEEERQEALPGAFPFPFFPAYHGVPWRCFPLLCCTCLLGLCDAAFWASSFLRPFALFPPVVVPPFHQPPLSRL